MTNEKMFLNDLICMLSNKIELYRFYLKNDLNRKIDIVTFWRRNVL